MNGIGLRVMVRGLRSYFRGSGFGLAVGSVVHGLGLAITPGSKFQTTVLQCKPHAAPPTCPPSRPPPPPHSYLVLGVNVRPRRQKRLDRGVVPLRSTAQCSGAFPYCATRLPVSQAHS